MPMRRSHWRNAGSNNHRYLLLMLQNYLWIYWLQKSEAAELEKTHIERRAIEDGGGVRKRELCSLFFSFVACHLSNSKHEK